MLKRVPIRLKLIVLAGVPVIGALILAAFIARDAQRQAEKAAAIGSIEDLAHLSAQMSTLVHALQFERNELSLNVALHSLNAPELAERFAQTDQARKRLEDFLATRKLASLPPRLARDLKAAESRLGGLQAERAAAVSGEQPIDELLSYYQTTDLALISATAALSQLSDDGEMIRAISALVTILQIKERASQEHALLSHVFALNEFPAGTYKDFVTLITEEADYVSTLGVIGTDGVNERLRAISRGPEFARTAELRKRALDTMNDDFRTNPREWSQLQGAKIEHLRGMEIDLNEAVERAALAKLQAAARSLRLSYGLGAGIIALSALLAGLIARGISRSVASLAQAAQQVRERKDFGVRAVKTSEDELGGLTDAFNEMLSGIQTRDQELHQHRENLEQIVEQRTLALRARNEAMRLVLDNVEQGLATIEPDGKLAPERSRAFDDWFGGENERDFTERLAPHDARVRMALKMGWEQVLEGFMPVDCALDQMPRHIQVQGRHYDLRYRAILERDTLRGALLVVSDITNDIERMQRDAEQRDLINVFERIMRDRKGFLEFFDNCKSLVDDFAAGSTDPVRAMRAVHTLKGNCGMVGVMSVAEVAHQLESALVEAGGAPSAEQALALTTAWQSFSERVRRLLGNDGEPVLELAHEELRELEACALARVPPAELVERLERLKHERAIVRLRRIAEQAKALARRLGKGELDVRLEAGSNVRFHSERWVPFWAALVHVVRNALDHGIEPPDSRLAAGKPEHGRLTLAVARHAGVLTIEVADDGRGIDWARVRKKAIERGLPHESQDQLVEALFCDGLTTVESVTEMSGRGVGLAAAREAARALGGTVHVSSKLGAGTTVQFRFTAPEARSLASDPRELSHP